MCLAACCDVRKDQEITVCYCLFTDICVCDAWRKTMPTVGSLPAGGGKSTQGLPVCSVVNWYLTWYENIHGPSKVTKSAADMCRGWDKVTAWGQLCSVCLPCVMYLSLNTSSFTGKLPRICVDWRLNPFHFGYMDLFIYLFFIKFSIYIFLF